MDVDDLHFQNTVEVATDHLEHFGIHESFLNHAFSLGEGFSHKEFGIILFPSLFIDHAQAVVSV